MRTENPFLSRREAALMAALLGLLVASCGRSPRGQPPASISRFPADLANRQLEPSGIFEDAWSAPAASLNLYQPDGKQLFVVRGMVPKIEREDFRTDLEVRVDKEVVARRSLGLGEFTLETRVPTKPGKRRIDLVFGAAQQLPAGDGRAIGARLTFAGFEPVPARRPGGGAEIVERGAGVRLGSGWDILETFKNETFRWVANDAQILVTAPQRGARRLSIALETGPGFEGRPFVLRVLDASGRQVDAAEVRGRDTVELFLPVEAGQDNDFRLHVDRGGKLLPGGDSRIMNFRVFQIDAY